MTALQLVSMSAQMITHGQTCELKKSGWLVRAVGGPYEMTMNLEKPLTNSEDKKMNVGINKLVGMHINIRAFPRPIRHQFEMIRLLTNNEFTTKEFEQKFGVTNPTIQRYIRNINAMLWDYQITRDNGRLKLVPAHEVDE